MMSPLQSPVEKQTEKLVIKNRLDYRWFIRIKRTLESELIVHPTYEQKRNSIIQVLIYCMSTRWDMLDRPSCLHDHVSLVLII